MQFLARRSSLLDAVVFSGGEPTLQDGLADVAMAVKSLGFKVGLHTAGIAGRGDKARASARLILDSGVDYEFRTTVHSALLSHKALTSLTHELAAMGVARYVLQEFRQQGCAQPLPAMQPAYLDGDAIKQLGRQFSHFSVRSA